MYRIIGAGSQNRFLNLNGTNRRDDALLLRFTSQIGNCTLGGPQCGCLNDTLCSYAGFVDVEEKKKTFHPTPPPPRCFLNLQISGCAKRNNEAGIGYRLCVDSGWDLSGLFDSDWKPSLVRFRKHCGRDWINSGAHHHCIAKWSD